MTSSKISTRKGTIFTRMQNTSLCDAQAFPSVCPYVSQLLFEIFHKGLCYISAHSSIIIMMDTILTFILKMFS